MLMTLKYLMWMVCMTALPTANGCGQLPAGREKQVDFSLTDFKLAAAMVYYDDPTARTKVSTISTSKRKAETFVWQLIMHSVEDVLYQQGRSALLPDSVISLILQQLDVQISYEPLKCENIVTEPLNPAGNGAVGNNKINCIIIDGTVTSTCSEAPALIAMCKHDMIAMHYTAIERKYFTISGSLKTSSAIMANWKNQMWQSVLDRVLRSITSRRDRSPFFGASVAIR